MTATVVPFGDGALLVEVDDVAAAHRLVAALEAARADGGAPTGLGEAVVGFGTVVVHLDPEHGPPDEVEAWLVDLARPGPATGPATPSRPVGRPRW